MTTHTVTFEPLDIEIECGEDETVLDAAFRDGYNLVYGCKEGQCSACKCYLLEGEVDLLPYSTFALSESEQQQGYTLLCRARPDSDLTVELLHYDSDNLRLANPIQVGSAQVTAVEPLTEDIRLLQLTINEPADFSFLAGQYVDIQVPGTDEVRSFSMSNLPGDGKLEFMIKCYPGGLFSGMIDTLELGQSISFTGPYGAFYARDDERPALMIAGGSGMAPVWSVLQHFAASGTSRRIAFYYGARKRKDLFYLDQIAAIGAMLKNFTFIPVLSDVDEDDDWAGATGFVHQAAAEFLDDVGHDVQAYMCGPPPMVEAAQDALAKRGVSSDSVFYDKFTTSASAAES